ncbi:MAG: fumarylacetoacetate hydrolase family protein [Acidimicrobiaceae bacterium]|nr:fumarylacetoacetate hydrolase family protein [Acidimicrobiaceae bacterium]
MVVAWGDRVVDLSALDGLDVGAECWGSGSLDAFFALGPDAWAATAAQLQARLVEPVPPGAVRARSDASMVLPFTVADYVDFYASEAHATHMGQLLRPGTDPLPRAWRHLPLGYHGRAGTVVASGTPIVRPSGLLGPCSYGPSQRLDVEVELGFVIGAGSAPGRPVPVDRAETHVFGVVLVNDWSARDIQAFEYQPLGPLLGKSFATSISPWVVPLAALAPFRVDGPAQDPPPAAHLRAIEPRGFDVRLELELCGTVVSRTSAADLYWSVAQLVAHLTSNGAALRAGDLLASGTISGWEPATQGSLMELTRAGADPIPLADGTERSWLEDGDTVVIRGWAGEEGLSLGEVSGTIEES